MDGGVSAANIKEVAEAGADMFVAGSAILKNPRCLPCHAMLWSLVICYA